MRQYDKWDPSERSQAENTKQIWVVDEDGVEDDVVMIVQEEENNNNNDVNNADNAIDMMIANYLENGWGQENISINLDGQTHYIPNAEHNIGLLAIETVGEEEDPNPDVVLELGDLRPGRVLRQFKA